MLPVNPTPAALPGRRPSGFHARQARAFESSDADRADSTASHGPLAQLLTGAGAPGGASAADFEGADVIDIDGWHLSIERVWEEILPQFEDRKLAPATLAALRALLGRLVSSRRSPHPPRFETFEDLAEKLLKRFNRKAAARVPVKFQPSPPGAASGWMRNALFFLYCFHLLGGTTGASLAGRTFRASIGAPRYRNLMAEQDGRSYPTHALQLPGSRILQKGVELPDGRYIYVWDAETGQIVVHPEEHGSNPQATDAVHHSDIACGHDVHAAGLLEFRNNSVLYADDRSGHYQPKDEVRVDSNTCEPDYALVSLEPLRRALTEIGMAAPAMVLEPANARDLGRLMRRCERQKARQKKSRREPPNPVFPLR
ncbi:hypothetical protein [Xylophilus sp. GOD-11R]|uniref:hypothetical protein n=1 Tax=Xylophilus sp. GOD-11R TaxID=3089814 RepID=UPI00298BF062|nr:hypothetical protein [Xylophilus sp. GOD-11R]WPB58705.1 hypothetical protein R9X41_08725 [Xylophilus sp. GOD-11R]